MRIRLPWTLDFGIRTPWTLDFRVLAPLNFGLRKTSYTSMFPRQNLPRKAGLFTRRLDWSGPVFEHPPTIPPCSIPNRCFSYGKGQYATTAWLSRGCRLAIGPMANRENRAGGTRVTDVSAVSARTVYTDKT